MQGLAARCGMTLLLLFTGLDVARAQPARPPGPTARLGTAVGFTQLGDETVTTLGGEVGLGYGIGPFVLEAQLDHASMLEQSDVTNTNEVRGVLSRWGVNGRAFAPALAWPGSAEPASVLRLFGEVGGGRQRGEWSTGEGFRRTDLTLGAGWQLEHAMHPRAAMPFRSIGWQMGWQVRASRADEPAGDHAAGGAYRSRCTTCGPPMPREADTELALVVSCSLTARW